MATGYMNEVTGRVSSRYSDIANYFQLKQTNEQLSKDNERLRNLLKEDFEKPDTTAKVVTDSSKIDSSHLENRKWLYQRAKVVYNSFTTQNNFIVIARGSAQGIKKDEGVVDAGNGIVGVVTDVSENFSVVMSLLHKDSKISAKLKNGGDAGQVIWDGKDPNILSLTDIKQSAKVNKGDTVFTSGVTTHFPYGIMIGTVTEVVHDKSSSNYFIKLKSTANFYNLQYVYAIDNSQRDEINRLLEKAKNKINN